MKDYTETTELNKTQDKEYEIPCPTCLVETVHKVLVSADVEGFHFDAGVRYWDNFQIVQCQGCRMISFRKNGRNTEDTIRVRLPNGSYDELLNDNEELYPSRIAGRGELKQKRLLPHQVLMVYDETHSAL